MRLLIVQCTKTMLPTLAVIGSLHFEIVVHAIALARADETAVGSAWKQMRGGQGGACSGSQVVINAAPVRGLSQNLLELINVLIVNWVEAEAMFCNTLTNEAQHTQYSNCLQAILSQGLSLWVAMGLSFRQPQVML